MRLGWGRGRLDFGGAAPCRLRLAARLRDLALELAAQHLAALHRSGQHGLVQRDAQLDPAPLQRLAQMRHERDVAVPSVIAAVAGVLPARRT